MQKTDPHLFEESSEEEELCDTFDEEIINSKLMNTFSRKKKKNESQIIPRRLGKVLNVDIYEGYSYIYSKEISNITKL